MMVEKESLEKRVADFNLHALPGQPLSTHMGTYYLVNELWQEIKRLREELKGDQNGKHKR